MASSFFRPAATVQDPVTVIRRALEAEMHGNRDSARIEILLAALAHALDDRKEDNVQTKSQEELSPLEQVCAPISERDALPPSSSSIPSIQQKEPEPTPQENGALDVLALLALQEEELKREDPNAFETTTQVHEKEARKIAEQTGCDLNEARKRLQWSKKPTEKVHPKGLLHHIRQRLKKVLELTKKDIETMESEEIN